MTVEQCWKNLALAVIAFAAADRRKALERLGMNPEHEHSKAVLEDVDGFFGSEWFGELVEMGGIGLEADEMRERLDGR